MYVQGQWIEEGLVTATCVKCGRECRIEFGADTCVDCR